MLSRDKFRRWLTSDEAGLFVELLESESETWPDPTDVPSATRDEKDEYLVALAHETDVDHLVSGDRDLTALTPTAFSVVTPGRLLEALTGQG